MPGENNLIFLDGKCFSCDTFWQEAWKGNLYSLILNLESIILFPLSFLKFKQTKLIKASAQRWIDVGHITFPKSTFWQSIRLTSFSILSFMGCERMEIMKESSQWIFVGNKCFLRNSLWLDIWQEEFSFISKIRLASFSLLSFTEDSFLNLLEHLLFILKRTSQKKWSSFLEFWIFSFKADPFITVDYLRNKTPDKKITLKLTGIYVASLVVSLGFWTSCMGIFIESLRFGYLSIIKLI